jgi:hypothetical protein
VYHIPRKSIENNTQNQTLVCNPIENQDSRTKGKMSLPTKIRNLSLEIIGRGSLKVDRECVDLSLLISNLQLVVIYSTELFLMMVRNMGLGCATQAAHMGAILASFVVVLGGGLPFLVFRVGGIVRGILVFHLLEKLNRPLYDTMEGMEDKGQMGQNGGGQGVATATPNFFLI